MEWTEAIQDGNVDYARMFNSDLPDAVREVAEAKLPSSPNEQYAFLLNAYNLVTLDCVQRVLFRNGKQVRLLQRPWTWLRFFIFTRVRVAGKSNSLYGLEFRRIKTHLRRDPRGHFALVCASIGCPPLKEGIYHGDNLDAELELATRNFVNASHFDKQHNVLRVSRIFKWYKRDFEAMGGIRKVIETYHNDDAVRQQKPKILYQKYDWNLNTV